MWHPTAPAPPAVRRQHQRRPRLPAPITTALLALWLTSTTRLSRAVEQRVEDTERGDVPGWVMVTLMTAGLVAVVWLLADEWLRELFQQAVDRVSGP